MLSISGCSAFSSSMPLMRGITRSVTTIDGRNAVTFSSASAPSAAASAVKPHVRTSSASPLRVAASSSTISTRSAACAGSAHFFSLSSSDPVHDIRDPRPPSPAATLDHGRRGSRSCCARDTRRSSSSASLLQAAGVRPAQADGSLSAPFVFALSLLDTVLLLSLIFAFLLRRGEQSATGVPRRPARCARSRRRAALGAGRHDDRHRWCR